MKHCKSINLKIKNNNFVGNKIIVFIVLIMARLINESDRTIAAIDLSLDLVPCLLFYLG